MKQYRINSPIRPFPNIPKHLNGFTNPATAAERMTPCLPPEESNVEFKLRTNADFIAWKCTNVPRLLGLLVSKHVLDFDEQQRIVS